MCPEKTPRSFGIENDKLESFLKALKTTLIKFEFVSPPNKLVKVLL